MATAASLRIARQMCLEQGKCDTKTTKRGHELKNLDALLTSSRPVTAAMRGGRPDGGGKCERNVLCEARAKLAGQVRDLLPSSAIRRLRVASESPLVPGVRETTWRRKLFTGW